MGTPLPPNEPGIVCTRCSGPGKPFHGIPTPKYLIVQLANLEPGEFWDPAREWELYSPFYVPQVGTGCNWQLFTNDWDVTLQFTDILDILTINDRVQAKDVFDAFVPPICTLDWINEIIVPTNKYSFGGTAKVSWIPFS